MSKKSDSGKILTYDTINLITDDFERDRENYYNLYAPAWGGYSYAATLNHPEVDTVDPSQMSVNTYEKLFFADYDHYLWLQRHPNFKGNHELTNKLARHRFKIMLHYKASDVEKQKKWANDRLFVEMSGFVKKILKDKSITDQNIYSDVLYECYNYLMTHISEYLDIDKKTGKPKIDIMQPTTFITYQVLHGITEAYSTIDKGTTRHYAVQMQAVTKAMDELIADGFTDPTSAEITVKLGGNWTVHKVEDTMQRIMMKTAISLESITIDLPDDEMSPEEHAIKTELKESLMAAISHLSDEEIEYVSLFHGIGKYEGKPHNYTEIANLYCTDDSQKDKKKGEIKRIIQKAYRKLARDHKLSSFYKNSNRPPKQDSITLNKHIDDFFNNLDDDDETIDGKKPDDLPI